MPDFLDTRDADFETRFATLLGAKREDSPEVDDVVAAIIADVRARGDAAVVELTQRFDRLALTAATLRFAPDEIEAECAQGRRRPNAQALELAAERIRAYHARQMPEDARWTDATGATLGWRWTPVSAAGLYVPGGLASYPSSVLMNAIPAKVAGVPRLAICVPTPGGVVNPLVLLAARHCRGGRDLPHRRRAGYRGAGLWHRDHRPGGQDHRAGQRLCRGGQAAGLRQGRHRHDRGAVRKSS